MDVFHTSTMSKLTPTPWPVDARTCSYMYTVSQKNDTDVAHCNYDIHVGILIIFGRYVTKKISN